MDEIYRNSEGIVCDILMHRVQNTGEISNTAYALYQQIDWMLECCECDGVEVALIDRFKNAKNVISCMHFSTFTVNLLKESIN
jgi:hypothetical protein